MEIIDYVGESQAQILPFKILNIFFISHIYDPNLQKKSLKFT